MDNLFDGFKLIVDKNSFYVLFYILCLMCICICVSYYKNVKVITVLYIEKYAVVMWHYYELIYLSL